MKASVCEHVEKHRVFSYSSSCFDPQVGLKLGHVQYLGAISEHRRRGASKEPAPVDLGYVSNELGLDRTRIRKKLRQIAEKIIIGHRFDFLLGSHTHNIRAGSETA
jgi:hypothetical protein